MHIHVLSGSLTRLPSKAKTTSPSPPHKKTTAVRGAKFDVYFKLFIFGDAPLIDHDQSMIHRNSPFFVPLFRSSSVVQQHGSYSSSHHRPPAPESHRSVIWLFVNFVVSFSDSSGRWNQQRLRFDAGQHEIFMAEPWLVIADDLQCLMNTAITTSVLAALVVIHTHISSWYIPYSHWILSPSKYDHQT